MNWQRSVVGVLAVVTAFVLGWSLAGRAAPDEKAKNGDKEPPKVKGWTPDKGWGWNWGKDDEVGALNAMTQDSVKEAVSLAKTGKVYDLGVPYDRSSFKWPGHSPAEIIMYRSPEGVKRQGDFKPAADKQANPDAVAWHSCALFINDNVATQIDGLGHVTVGDDNHWYNGFKEADWGGNFGIRKCDAVSIPPIVTRGVMIDVAGLRGVDALPSNYRITADVLQAALEKQKTELHPGDSVFIRTGTLRFWGKDGSDHDTLKKHDTAGIDLGAAKWLVEKKGAILIGSDTSGLEWGPGPEEKTTGFIPVHKYLLIEQGVHIGEFHYLEDLAKDRAYEFCYICTVNQIRGTVAGFTLRPIAIR